MSMTLNKECRVCQGKKLVKVIDLGLQPLANAFLRKEDIGKLEAKYPLEVYFCEKCSLAQLIHVVDKEILFRDYIYFSSGMPKLSNHFQSYAEDVIARFLKKKNDLVVEVGSNDGILLRFFKERGFRVLGVDPAKNIAKVANENGVTTVADFWSAKLAKDLGRAHGAAAAILGNNVVAHINDYDGLCRGVKSLLSKSGVFVFEAPYLVDMFKNLTFDTIYHEHLSYLAIRPLLALFKKYDLEIFEVKIVEAQGQSIRVFVGHKGAHKVRRSVAECIKEELALGLNKKESYLMLAEKIRKYKVKTKNLLTKLKNEGKKISAYGAPAKGNTLLNYYGIGTELLDYAMDELPSKQGLYTPGTHILVVPKDYTRVHRVDYYLLLAWNYAKVILEKEKEFLDDGGAFILPTGKIITQKSYNLNLLGKNTPHVKGF